MIFLILKPRFKPRHIYNIKKNPKSICTILNIFCKIVNLLLTHAIFFDIMTTNLVFIG